MVLVVIWRKIKIDPYLIPYTKIYTKQIRHLKVKSITIQVLDKNIHEFLYNLGAGKGFQTITQNVDAIKEKTKLINFI